MRFSVLGFALLLSIAQTLCWFVSLCVCRFGSIHLDGVPSFHRCPFGYFDCYHQATTVANCSLAPIFDRLDLPDRRKGTFKDGRLHIHVLLALVSLRDLLMDALQSLSHEQTPEWSDWAPFPHRHSRPPYS